MTAYTLIPTAHHSESQPEVLSSSIEVPSISPGLELQTPKSLAVNPEVSCHVQDNALMDDTDGDFVQVHSPLVVDAAANDDEEDDDMTVLGDKQEHSANESDEGDLRASPGFGGGPVPFPFGHHPQAGQHHRGPLGFGRPTPHHGYDGRPHHHHRQGRRHEFGPSPAEIKYHLVKAALADALLKRLSNKRFPNADLAPPSSDSTGPPSHQARHGRGRGSSATPLPKTPDTFLAGMAYLDVLAPFNEGFPRGPHSHPFSHPHPFGFGGARGGPSPSHDQPGFEFEGRFAGPPPFPPPPASEFAGQPHLFGPGFEFHPFGFGHGHPHGRRPGRRPGHPSDHQSKKNAKSNANKKEYDVACSEESDLETTADARRRTNRSQSVPPPPESARHRPGRPGPRPFPTKDGLPGTFDFFEPHHHRGGFACGRRGHLHPHHARHGPSPFGPFGHSGRPDLFELVFGPYKPAERAAWGGGRGGFGGPGRGGRGPCFGRGHGADVREEQDEDLTKRFSESVVV